MQEMTSFNQLAWGNHFPLPNATVLRSSAIGTTFQLHLLVVIFAATTILARLTTVSTPVLVTWRCLIAAAGAFLWVFLTQRKRDRLTTRKILTLCGIGAIIGVHWLCLFGSVKISNVSIALAGLATLSLFTAFTEPLLSRHRIRPVEVILGLLVLAGICLIAGVEQSHFFGLCLALLSALLAAIFLVLNRHVVISGVHPMTMVGWEMATAAFVCFFAVPFLDPLGFKALWFTNPYDWLWILILALVCTVFAQALTNHLLRSLSAYTFNLVSNFEPVYGILAAAWLFGEYASLRPAFYLGAFTIVLANFLHPVLHRRLAKP